MFELVENLGSQRVLYCIIHVDKSILFERHERALLGFEDCLPPTPGGGEGGGGTGLRSSQLHTNSTV